MDFNLRLIPLLPFIGATLLMLFGRRWKRETVVLVACSAVLAAGLVVFDAFFTRLPEAAEAGGLTDNVWTWFAVGSGPTGLHVDLAFRMDALSGLLCLIITFIGFLIHVYAAGYMEHEPDCATEVISVKLMVPLYWNSRNIPSKNPKSPMRLVMNAFLPALALALSVYQKPMSR